MVDVHMLAATVRQHQVGAFPLGDDAAIVKAQRLRRMLADQTDRLRQGEGVILGVGDAESGIQQAGGVIVRRKNVQQTTARQLVRRDVARVGTAAHDIGGAHQDVHPMLT